MCDHNVELLEISLLILDMLCHYAQTVGFKLRVDGCKVKTFFTCLYVTYFFLTAVS